MKKTHRTKKELKDSIEAIPENVLLPENPKEGSLPGQVHSERRNTHATP